MAFLDIRHIVAGVLTLSMFVMLVHMIKSDYFDSPVNVREITSSQYVAVNFSAQNLVTPSDLSKGLLSDAIKPCWTQPPQYDWEESKGFITFSLTRGLEYHVSEVANAVLVAKHLRATLVLPDIIEHKSGDKRKFEEIYDVHKFVMSLSGVVKVASMQPAGVSGGKPTSVAVPNGASEDYLSSKIEPLFKQKGSLKLITYFPTSSKKNVERANYMDQISCLAFFEALRLQAGLQKIVDSMLESIRTLNRKSDGLFVAVDLSVERLSTKGCREKMATGRKKCYTALEIGQFLKKIGLQSDTAIYLTQNQWHESFDGLRDVYPNTYTKETLMPAKNVVRSLISRSSEFAKVIDFHICSQSDVFVPTSSNLFYTNVVGARIALGKTEVLVPYQANSVKPVEYISPYIANKTHSAYSCFC